MTHHDSDKDTGKPLPFHGVLLWRGILGMAFGFVMVFWPREELTPSLLVLPVAQVDWLLLGYLVLNAVLLILQARSPHLPAGCSLIVWGQVIVTLPGILFLVVAEQAGQLVAAISVWVLLHGLLEAWLWRTLRERYRGASDFLIAGGIHLFLALVLFINPAMQPLAILGFTGAAALMTGVVFVLGAITARKRLKFQAAAEN